MVQCEPLDGYGFCVYNMPGVVQCEPLDGYGFRRGGYQCRCKPGHRLPNVVRRPYLGEVLERATSEQYRHAFHCENIGCETSGGLRHIIGIHLMSYL